LENQLFPYGFTFNFILPVLLFKGKNQEAGSGAVAGCSRASYRRGRSGYQLPWKMFLFLNRRILPGAMIWIRKTN